MKSIQWRHTDWSARRFVFQAGQELIGQLVFANNWNFDATYSSSDSRLTFTEKGFWDRKVHITRDGVEVALLTNTLFGKALLQLHSGEVYQLKSNFLGRNIQWLNSQDEVVIQYKQATLSTMGKGTVQFHQTLSNATEQLLLSSGLYMPRLVVKRMMTVMVCCIPIMAAASRH